MIGPFLKMFFVLEGSDHVVFIFRTFDFVVVDLVRQSGRIRRSENRLCSYSIDKFDVCLNPSRLH